MSVISKIKIIRTFFFDLFEKYSKEKKLHQFNISSSHNVQSEDVSLKALKGNNITILKGSSVCENSTIGSYTYIGTNSSITKSSIGRYCSIGNNVSIGPGEHNLNAISTSALFYKSPLDELTQKECTIGNDVWIGVDCIIKRGVNIADGAVIGANSVVTKNVPAYAIVAGSPAKILRYRFDEQTIKKIEASAWWDSDLEVANQILKKLDTEISKQPDTY